MSTYSSFQIDRLDTLVQLEALQDEWTDLIKGIPGAPVFLTWEWIRTWWLYFGKDRQMWLLTARDNQGRLLGLAPLMREYHRIGLMKLRKIAFIGAGLVYPVHLNILTQISEQEELFQAFLAFLLSHSDQWDVISFSCVDQESPINSLLTAAGGHVCIGTPKTSPYVPLPGSWEAFLKTISKKLRRNLKYFRSKLDNDFPSGVDFTCVTDPREIREIMKKLEELNKSRWHAQEITSNFDQLNFSDFHQSIASLALERGWLRLNKLTVLGRVIAVYYNFLFHNRVYAYSMGFDLDWSKYSPGRLGVAYSIQASILESASEYDWLGGEDAYKLAWADKVRVEKEILFSKNLPGGLWIEWRNFLEILKGKARQWLPQPVRYRIRHFLATRHKITEDRDDKDGE
jgi:CelD/BcsL family acetyltransferase involved in cellulose biosynthesis